MEAISQVCRNPNNPFGVCAGWASFINLGTVLSECIHCCFAYSLTHCTVSQHSERLSYFISLFWVYDATLLLLTNQFQLISRIQEKMEQRFDTTKLTTSILNLILAKFVHWKIHVWNYMGSCKECPELWESMYIKMRDTLEWGMSFIYRSLLWLSLTFSLLQSLKLYE